MPCISSSKQYSLFLVPGLAGSLINPLESGSARCAALGSSKARHNEVIHDAHPYTVLLDSLVRAIPKGALLAYVSHRAVRYWLLAGCHRTMHFPHCHS